MAKSNVSTISNREEKKSKSVGRKLSDVHIRPATQTDRPEYIKSAELTTKHPFTIYGAREKTGDYGDRIFFQVAWKDANGETVKRLWTPTANDERRELMKEVKKSAIINCRLLEVPTNGRYDYFKIIDADSDVESVIAEATELLRKDESDNPDVDEDIPF